MDLFWCLVVIVVGIVLLGKRRVNTGNPVAPQLPERTEPFTYHGESGRTIRAMSLAEAESTDRMLMESKRFIDRRCAAYAAYYGHRFQPDNLRCRCGKDEREFLLEKATYERSPDNEDDWCPIFYGLTDYERFLVYEEETKAGRWRKS